MLRLRTCTENPRNSSPYELNRKPCRAWSALGLLCSLFALGTCDAAQSGVAGSSAAPAVQSDQSRMWMSVDTMKRLGRGEEIADAVLSLCSSGSSFVTGQALAVDGGFSVY